VRHGRQHRSSATLGLLRIIGIALTVVLVSAGTVGGYAVWNLGNQIHDNGVPIGDQDEALPPSIGEFTGGFNLLVVGADNDSDQGATYGVRDATLNDVNILLHVSADHTTATAVSFPRDLLVSQPECTNPDTGVVSSAVYNRSLNAAIGRGGLACVVHTLEDLTGLDIDYAAQMSFDAVVNMTDAVGGVEVCVASDIDDSFTGLHLDAGTHTISGVTALKFLRNRHGVGDQSDLARIASQQVYLSSLVRTLKSSETLTNVTKLYSLATVAAHSITLSTSLTSLDRMVSMALTLKTINLDELAFVQYPVVTSSIDSNKVAPAQDLADALFEKLDNDEPVVLSDDSVRAGSAVVDEDADDADSGDTDSDDTATSTPTATATPGATDTPTSTPTPEEEVDPLDDYTGQMATQTTCSVGN
jgi:LCP family protein required for cell wall assembly